MRSRAEFTKPTRRAALQRSRGICECHRVPQLMALLHNRPCGCALTVGNIEYDHIIADGLRPDRSLDNCACLTKTCHALKSDQHDKPAIAEAKRREDHHYGIDGPGLGSNPMRGGRRSDETRSFNGKVNRRRSLTEKLVDAGIIHPKDLEAAR